MSVRNHQCSVANLAPEFRAHVLRKFLRNRGSNSEGFESPSGLGVSLANRRDKPFICPRWRLLSPAKRLSATKVESSVCQSTQRCLGVLVQPFFSRSQIQSANVFPSFAKAVRPNAKGETNQIFHPKIVTKLSASEVFNIFIRSQLHA